MFRGSSKNEYSSGNLETGDGEQLYLDSGTYMHVPDLILGFLNVLERVLIGFVTIADGKIFLIFSASVVFP